MPWSEAVSGRFPAGTAIVSPLGPFGLQVEALAPGQELRLSAAELRILIEETPLLLFRGFASMSRDQLLAIASLGGPDDPADLLHWDFGPVMELQVKPDPQNYLFSTEDVPYHWDGAFHRAPSFLVFNCLEAPLPGAGGETLFCDTRRILADAGEADRALWQDTRLTYRTEKKAHYGGEVSVSMIDRHPRTGAPILRYAEPVETRLNPVTLEVEGPFAGRSSELTSSLRARLYDEAYCYAHRWQDGDLLVADNHALIHGRRAFRQATPRHIRRVQIL